MFGRAGRHDLGAAVDEQLFDFGVLHRGRDGGVDLGGGVGRHALGAEELHAARHVHAGIARLRHVGQLAQRAVGLGVGVGQHLDPAGLGKVERRRRAIEQEIDLAADQCHTDSGRALERHMGHLGAGGMLQHLGHQVRGRAQRERRVVQLVRVGLGIVDQVFHGVEGRRGRHDQHRARAGREHHRHQVFQRVIGQLGEQVRVLARGHADRVQDGVAIGRRLQQFLHAQDGAGARLVFDQHGHAQCRLHFGRQHAGLDIGQSGHRPGMAR